MADSRPSAARRLVGPLLDRRTWAGTAFLLVGAVPSGVALAAVLTGLLLGGILAPLGLGLLLLPAALLTARAAAELDRRVLAAVLDLQEELDREDAERAAPGTPWIARIRALLTAARTWRSLAWLALRAGAGLLVLLGLLVTGTVAVALLAVPFVDGYLAFGSTWRSDAGWASAWTLPVAAVLLLGVAHALRGLVEAHVRLAVLLLGPDPAERVGLLQRAIDRSEEQAQVARELHDGLGHALTLVVVQAEASAAALQLDPGAARRHLEAVTTAARRALDDLDHALGLLQGRPGTPPAPTLDDLPGLVRTAREAGLDLRLDRSDDLLPVPSPISRAAYRVVQEAVTNALRHSSSREAHVEVQAQGNSLTVAVSSPVGRGRRGVPDRSTGGRGLDGLRRRVLDTGGTFDAGRQDGRFVVRAAWTRT